MFNVVLDDVHHDQGPIILHHVNAERAIQQLLERVVQRVQQDHLAAGRPRSALAVISLSFDEIDYPMNSQMHGLFDPLLIPSFFSMLKNVMVSKRTLTVNQEFFLHVTVIDDEDDPAQLWVAGPKNDAPKDWDALSLGKKRHLYLMPSFDNESRFADCCLLSAITFSMTFNEHQRRRLTGGVSRNFCNVRQINAGEKGKGPRVLQRRKKAERHLHNRIAEVVETHSLNLHVFRECLTPSEELKREIEKLNINLVCYKDESRFKPFFQWPNQFDAKKQSVHVLLVKLGSADKYHAASILKPEAYHCNFMKQGSYCPRCKKNFTTKYALRHRCSGAVSCTRCRKPKLQQDDYYDMSVKEATCSAPREPLLSCKRCKNSFGSMQCYEDHKARCFHDSTYCLECGQVYRKSRGKHMCGQRFCRYCSTKYTPDESLGEGQHHCEQKRPKPPQSFSKIGVFDMETRTDNDDREHKVNAIGVSFETARGVFSEIYFYDEEMNHPQNSVLLEDNFRFRYWCEDLDGETGKWGYKPRKNFNYEFPRSISRSEDVDGLGQEEEEEEVQDGSRARPNLSFALSEAREVGGGNDGEDDEDEEGGRNDGFFESVTSYTPSSAGSAMGQFVDFLLDKKFYGYTFLCHNGAR